MTATASTEEKIKLYETFMCMAVHEIKTPLTVLKAYLQIHLHEVEKEGLHQFEPILRKMDLQLDKIQTLLSDLQDAALFKSEGIYCLMNNFDARRLINSCAENISAAHPDFSVLVDVPDQEIIIRGDQERIEQVINNLVNNAVKYSHREKYIRLLCCRSGDNLVISVIDKGPGIPASEQKQIFQQFYRMQCPNTKNQPGLGLGLFICVEIVKKHQGEIGLNSMEGEGSEFWFSLPLKKT